MPASFKLPLDFGDDRPSELWSPLDLQKPQWASWGDHSLIGIARLGDGVVEEHHPDLTGLGAEPDGFPGQLVPCLAQQVQCLQYATQVRPPSMEVERVPSAVPAKKCRLSSGSTSTPVMAMLGSPTDQLLPPSWVRKIPV